MLSTAIVKRMTASLDSLVRRLKPDADAPATPMQAPIAAAAISITAIERLF